MKTVVSFAAITFVSVAISLAAGDKETIIEKEKTVWQTVQDKKLDAFRKYFAEDYRSVYAEGIYNINQEMDAVRKTDLKSFSFSDTTVVFPDKDTALLTYKVTAQGTQGGKDMSGTYNCASVWHKSGAEWQAIFHTEVKPQP
jgi:hypothetical protein